ncbi:hypothetical protein B0J14DRAFT_582099 [Halenospora varia]|nr:hypothetical protein B0J14DRAFT_582099 [Halenospora varia]
MDYNTVGIQYYFSLNDGNSTVESQLFTVVADMSATTSSSISEFLTTSVASTSSSSHAPSLNTPSVTSSVSEPLTTTFSTSVRSSSSGHSQISASITSSNQPTSSAVAVPLTPVSKDLSNGAKAGIAVGAILGVAAIAGIMLCILFLGRRTARRKKEDLSSEDRSAEIEGEGASAQGGGQRISELGDGLVKAQRLSELSGNPVKIQRYSELDGGMSDGIRLKLDQVAELDGSVVVNLQNDEGRGDQEIVEEITARECQRELKNEAENVHCGEKDGNGR